MQDHASKNQDNQSRAVANEPSRSQDDRKATFGFVDNRPEAIQLRKLQELADNSPQAEKTAQFQTMADNRLNSASTDGQVIQRQINMD